MAPNTCDRCGCIVVDGVNGAASYIHKDGRGFMFCKVHAREHGPALLKAGWMPEETEARV